MTDYDNIDFWHPGDPDIYENLEDDERIVATICHIAGMIICFVILLGLCAMCSSCTTTQYVPVPEYHTDTLIQTKVVHDSIHVKDSTHVEWKDSIIKIEHWHTEYVDHAVHDTTYIAKNDTVPQPYPVVKEVERKRTTTDWVLMIAGMLAIIGVIVWVVNKVKRFLPGM